MSVCNSIASDALFYDPDFGPTVTAGKGHRTGHGRVSLACSLTTITATNTTMSSSSSSSSSQPTPTPHHHHHHHHRRSD
jgi:hypothetical protein